MSIYNMVHGMNAELTTIVSTVLGFRVDEKFPRFRNVFTEDADAPFEADLFVYTRMGAGNRDCWEDDAEGCKCAAHEADAIENEPWCVGSYDDSYDATYRTFGVKFLPEQKAEWERLNVGGPDDAFMDRLFALHPKLKARVDGADAPKEQP